MVGGLQPPPAAADRAPVVSVLVGAGALESLERLFSTMPGQPGCAFLILGDLSGDLDQFVQRLVARRTGLPARAAALGEPLEPGSVWLAAGAASLDDHLAALAADPATPAAALVLSGDRLPGARGLRALHATGRPVLVQEPATAAFDAMPLAALEAVPGALVLPAERMLDELSPLLRHDPARDDAEAPLDEVLALLGRRFGIDFGAYRQPLLMRRLRRRAALRRLTDLDAYMTLLRHDAPELERLHDDLLIGVTGFMRDPEAFAALARHVLPTLAARRRPLRIWVPGCASGEEAVSLAIVLREHGLASGQPLEFAIFATDLHRRSLDLAARGLYPEERLRDLDPALVERHFARDEEGWRPRRELRRRIVFSAHDLLADPPLARMDLVSCRNLLIYLAPEAQRRALACLHEALLPGGHLFLGSSEHATAPHGGFVPIDPRACIYRKPELPATAPPAPPGARPHPPPPELPAAAPLPSPIEALVTHLAPPGLLLDEHGGILRVLHEAALCRALGTARIDGAALRGDLVAAIAVARATGSASVACGAAGSATLTRLPAADRPCFLLAVERRGGAAQMAEPGAGLARLEHELGDMAAALQASLDDQQAAIEELRAANDELQAANDQLSSVNEELHLVSAEHEARLGELVQLAADMENLLRGTRLGVVFLDEELAVRRFTPRATELFAVAPEDVGRTIHDIRWRFDYPDLECDLARCLRHEIALGRDVRTFEGRLFRLETSPYRLHSGEVGGVVLVFDDIGPLRRAQEHARREASFAAALAELIDRPVCRLDAALRVVAANAAFARAVASDPAALNGRALLELVPCRAHARLGAAAARLSPSGPDATVLLDRHAGALPRRWTLQAFFAEQGWLVELQAVGGEPEAGE